MTHKRMRPTDRQAEILYAALQAAEASHYTTITREDIAKRAGVSGSAVSYHFDNMDVLRAQLMRLAITREFLPVIAQGCVAGDQYALSAPEELRRRAINSVL